MVGGSQQQRISEGIQLRLWLYDAERGNRVVCCQGYIGSGHLPLPVE